MADVAVHTSITERVAVLTLSHPARRNALNIALSALLGEAVRAAADDPGVGAIVITGEDPAFCAGGDLAELATAGPAQLKTVYAGFLAIAECPLPTIAAVNGAAVGWGMELALMADIRVASERARFGELFVLRGLCSDVAGIGRLAGLVGRERAAELLFTGEILDAGRARDIGLVSRVVPHDQLVPTAQELAARIAANPPLAVRKLKEGLRRALDPDWTELGRWVSSSLHELFRTEDHREGVAAFLERRAPSYTGR